MPRLLWPSWRWITISGTPFASHLDGVRVPQLVRREAPPDTGRDRRPAQVAAGGGAGPLTPTRRAGENAEERSDGKFDSRLEPGLQLGPAPRVHPDLAAPSALAATDQHGAAALIEIGLSERERLVDAQPGAPENHDQAAQPAAVIAVTGRAHDGDDLLDLGRIGGVPQTLVARRATGVESRHRRRRSTTTRAIEQQLRHDLSSGSLDEPPGSGESAQRATLPAGSAIGRLPVSERSSGGTGFAATSRVPEAVGKTAAIPWHQWWDDAVTSTLTTTRDTPAPRDFTCLRCPTGLVAPDSFQFALQPRLEAIAALRGAAVRTVRAGP